MLQDLMAERRQPGDSYGWFVAVALQRILGISPQQVKARIRSVLAPMDGWSFRRIHDSI